jgi:hypothetical protein
MHHIWLSSEIPSYNLNDLFEPQFGLQIRIYKHLPDRYTSTWYNILPTVMHCE